MTLQELPIGDFLEPVSNWKQKDAFADDSFRYIDLSSVDQDTKEIRLNGEILVKDAPSRARQILKPDDILVSTVRPNLNGVAVVPEDCEGAIGSTGFCVLRPKPKRLCNRYLFHWVRSPQFVADMTKKATGQSYPAISDKIVKESLIPLPIDINEQKRIAAILDQADSLRRARRQAIEKLNTFSQSLFQEMFGEDKKIPTLPLEKVADLKRGPFGGALKKEIFVESGYKVYEQSHAIQKDFSIGRYFISEVKYKDMEGFAVQKDDLIISCSGTLGRVYRIPSEADKGIINQALLRIRSNTKIMYPEFLEHFFESTMMQRFLTGFSRGTGLQNFPPMEEVRQIPVPAPKKEIQEEFLRKIRGAESLKSDSNKALKAVEHLFLSLQQRAFRGEL